ncbi:DEAD/DEAH box helicase [uncultured Williamsia sp.]|uniref:DEAD/DEAH box helicase n=1 Tax=uncultured Williamsia sp. TaxID=259311 RepID=UPI0026278449|nr:DEAD/DEAH box helicase [uncultured Williamsia sp.]
MTDARVPRPSTPPRQPRSTGPSQARRRRRSFRGRLPPPRERHRTRVRADATPEGTDISTDNISTADETTDTDGTTIVTGESPIDPDVPQTTIVDTDTHVAPTFAELGVSDEIVAALEADGKTHTFAIQELTLPLALAGDDLIGQARTGMGKTFGFGVPLLHRITQVKPGSDGPLRPLDGTPRALVIVPTRELCLQVTGDLQVAGKGIEVDPQPNPKRKLSIVSIYGGRPYESQIAELQAGADVVVGTPGRLLDLAQQGHLILGKVQILVLDEADEMLDLGFLPDIERIMRALPDQRQTMLFSATMPGPIVTLARTFLNRPTHIRAEHAGDSAVHDRTKQHAYRAHALDKAELVARVLQAEGRGATMIFTRTKRTAQKVADDLAERGFKVGAVHGDLGQVAREKALGRFRDGSIDVIVATDVAARGIDIDDVTHVINYQCPEDDKAYVHRIGRTGRAGRTGIAVTLVDWDELHKWKLINDALDLGIPEPVETYSSSEHLRSDLSIPESATGRIAPPAPKEREGTSDGGRREQRAPRANRERRRTRGARSADDGAPAAKAPKAPTSETSSDSSGPDSAQSDGDGSSRPRRRRRRGRGRGASAEGSTSSQATASSDQ